MCIRVHPRCIHKSSMYNETHLATMGEPAFVSSSTVASGKVLARLPSRLWPFGRDWYRPRIYVVLLQCA